MMDSNFFSFNTNKILMLYIRFKNNNSLIKTNIKINK